MSEMIKPLPAKSILLTKASLTFSLVAAIVFAFAAGPDHDQSAHPCSPSLSALYAFQSVIF